MGCQILSDNGDGLTLVEALKRVCFGFFAICSAYFVNSRPSRQKQGQILAGPEIWHARCNAELIALNLRFAAHPPETIV